MSTHDLEHFKIDCRIKEQQIRFLQSMRTSMDQRIAAGTIAAATPWRIFTDPERHQRNVYIHNGQSNWLINQHLLRLSYDCP